MPTFKTPYDQYRERDGQRIEVIRELTEADGVDEECLPVFVALFPDGELLHVLPEEIEDWPALDEILSRWAQVRGQ